jgi:hypothetical protein
LSTTRNRWFFKKAHRLLPTLFLTGALASATAQTASPIFAGETEAKAELPDAPGMSSSSSAYTFAAAPHSTADFSFDSAPSTSEPVRITKYVSPGTHAPSLSAGDKILLGFRGAVYPIPALGWLGSAAFSQGLDHSPNYGTDTKAFFQRLGAAAARNSSEGIISDSIMATVLHEDPRYYKMGKGHSFVKRLGNAVEHVVLTRTDDGVQTINYSLISGNLAGSALTNAYYPPRNRSFGSTMTTFALSLSGSALGFTVAEFYSDAMEIVHPKK